MKCWSPSLASGRIVFPTFSWTSLGRPALAQASRAKFSLCPWLFRLLRAGREELKALCASFWLFLFGIPHSVR